MTKDCLPVRMETEFIADGDKPDPALIVVERMVEKTGVRETNTDDVGVGAHCSIASWGRCSSNVGQRGLHGRVDHIGGSSSRGSRGDSRGSRGWTCT